MIFTIQSNIAAKRAKLAYIKGNLTSTIQKSLLDGGTQVAQNLATASPKGKSGSGETIPGDTPGPLSASFLAKAKQSSMASVVIVSNQPTKLKFVTGGTGIYGPTGRRIVPTTAKALFWPGAQHPVRSVAGQKPNDFVSPVILTGRALIRQKAIADVMTLMRTLGNG